MKSQAQKWKGPTFRVLPHFRSKINWRKYKIGCYSAIYLELLRLHYQ